MLRLSNRLKLITGALGIIVLGMAVFSYLTYLQISALIHQEENKYIQQTMEKWDRWSEHNFSLLTSLADTIAAEPKEMRHDEKYQFFISQATKSWDLQSIGFGLEDGYFAVAGWDIPEGFDPRERPWYKTSKSSLTPKVSWPYKSITIDDPLYISFTVPIIKNDLFLGVVTGDVTMGFLVNNLISELLTRGGNAFLIDESGRILIHQDQHWIGKHLSELEPFFSGEQVFPVDNYHYLADGNSTNYRITSLNNADYLLVLSMNKEHQDQLLKNELFQLLGYAPFVVLLVLISLYFYNKKLFLPIIHSLEYDSNTKLPNKTNVKKKIQNRFLTHNKDGMLIIISLNDFNRLIAAYPKSTIMSLQYAVKDRLQNLLSSNSLLGFYSENSFIVYSPFSICDTELERLTYLQSLSDEITKAYIINNQEFHFTFCIGASCFPSDTLELEQLIDNAFSAMESTREDEMLNYSLYVPEHKLQLGKAILMSNGIKKAILNNEFQLVFQPQIDARKNDLVGVEALIRWPSSELKRMVSPIEFIPVAEASDLIVEIGDYVINAVVKQIKLWEHQGVKFRKVSINISPRQLLKDDFLMKISEVIRINNVDAKQIELEITETTVLSNPEKSIDVMQKLKDKGFSIAMDDFGTGYSSLEYLKIMPLTKLKIDRTFIKNLDTDTRDGVIVKMVMAMADALDYQVIAEGVENKAQLSYLQANDCHLIQGYYFAKPLEASKLAPFLSKELIV